MAYLLPQTFLCSVFSLILIPDVGIAGHQCACVFSFCCCDKMPERVNIRKRLRGSMNTWTVGFRLWWGMSAVECVTAKCCPHGQEAEEVWSGLECHSPLYRHAVSYLQTIAVCSWSQRPVLHSCCVLRGFSDLHFAPYLESIASCFL